jgi:hypothetical protein
MFHERVALPESLDPPYFNKYNNNLRLLALIYAIRVGSIASALIAIRALWCC